MGELVPPPLRYCVPSAHDVPGTVCTHGREQPYVPGTSIIGMGTGMYTHGTMHIHPVPTDLQPIHKKMAGNRSWAVGHLYTMKSGLQTCIK